MNKIVPDRTGVRSLDLMDSLEPSAVPFGLTPRTGSPPDKSIAVRPLHDRVLVRRAATQEKAGAIFIPDHAQEKALRGIVIAVGPGRHFEDERGNRYFQPTQVKPGDEVLFTGSVNVAYPDIVEWGELVMMSEQDIIGVLTDRKPCSECSAGRVRPRLCRAVRLNGVPGGSDGVPSDS
jgi:chaperonin GroES